MSPRATRQPDDGHLHEWYEETQPADPGTGAKARVVTKCGACGCVRCGDTFDADPCLLRFGHPQPRCVHEITGCTA